MKKISIYLITGLVFTFVFVGNSAALEFDQNVTPDVIFGTGNANGSFTVDRNNGVELGLRGKLRFDQNGYPQNIFNSNGDGTYSFEAGVAINGFSPATPIWNFEWSINTGIDDSLTNVLPAFSYELGIDFDPGLATNYFIFDPINVNYADHQLLDLFGFSIVAENADEYMAVLDFSIVAQNSWNMDFFDEYSPLGTFDPTVDGTYDFFLTAFDGNRDQLAQTSMQIIVGLGGSGLAPVPEPASLILLATGLAGLAGFGRKKLIRK